MEVGDVRMAENLLVVGVGGGSDQHVVGEEFLTWFGQNLHVFMSDARACFFTTIVEADVSLLSKVTESVPEGGNVRK